ncbi:MAG TPA: ribosome maturation factor RimP [Marmoricola sp.]
MSSTDRNEVQRLVALLSAPVAELGLDLEAVEVTAAGKRRIVRVAVDQDGGVTMDDIADATRAVSTTLDDADALGERPYTLEVSSPGVDRPLTLPRHWRRNTGRLVKVTLEDGTVMTGRIVGNDDETVRLEIGGSERPVTLTAVKKAKVQIEFKSRESD